MLTAAVYFSAFDTQRMNVFTAKPAVFALAMQLAKMKTCFALKKRWIKAENYQVKDDAKNNNVFLNHSAGSRTLLHVRL